MRYRVDVDIQREAAEVFAFLSDLRNELAWNPGAEEVTMLTPGPIGVGTRFAAKWANAPKSVVEVAAYDPPHLWATRSRSIGMDVVFRGSLTATETTTRYMAEVTVEASGWGRLLAPLAVWAMRRREASNMRRIKDVLEERATPAPTVQPGGTRT